MPSSPKTGVLLVNLGTPDEPTPGAVRRYLRQFLSDPRVVELPRAVWLPLLYLVVLPFRPAKTAKKYAAIWMNDGSPLRVYTARQSQLLRGYLGERFKSQVQVAFAMRYGQPSIAAGLAELAEKSCERVLVIPLYPQYAGSTTGSVSDAVHAAAKRMKNAPKVAVVRDFHDHPAYVKAVAKNVNEYWMKHGRPDKLVMSFHGIPKAVAERGDPYVDQCKRTAELIAIELGWNDARTLVTFQSRFGKAEWVKPYTQETLEKLGANKTARVDVICPGFAADCLETLEEISMEVRDAFKAAGGRDFHYIPTTNDTPAFMTALAALTQEKLHADSDRTLAP
ncbi:ferrochelatase [Betaproteobacteria bacterium GR16-43]|nr:ferrochelatase [Betaproteobacteria bacterium GR16-43]